MADQPDLALGIPQLLALMVAEVSFVVALIGGSIFVGVRVARSGTAPRVTVLYLIMAVLAYHFIRYVIFDMSRRMQNFIASDSLAPGLEIWIAVAAWTYGAVLTWGSLSLRAPGKAQA